MKLNATSLADGEDDFVVDKYVEDVIKISCHTVGGGKYIGDPYYTIHCRDRYGNVRVSTYTLRHYNRIIIKITEL